MRFVWENKGCDIKAVLVVWLQDGRYRDRNWVQYTRKWPPRLVQALEGILDVKAVAK